MRKLIGGVAALLGALSAGVGGWLLVRGPFFGGQTLESTAMVVALISCLIGVIVVCWGMVQWVGVGARL